MNTLDMSQMPNRFSILAHYDSESAQPESQAGKPIMSFDNLPSASSPSSSSSSVYALPERVYVRSARLKFSTNIQVQIKCLDTGAQHDLQALLDSGATGLFLSTSLVERNNLNTRKLPRAIPVYNVDGTLNQGGSITEEVDVIMTYQDHTEKATFAVCDLGDKDAIIGHTWLFSHNPEIDWQSGKVQLSRCPPKCKVLVNKKEGIHQHSRRNRLVLLLEQSVWGDW